MSREIQYRVWCEFTIDGEKHAEMAGPENWFLLTQTGKLMSHGPMRFNPNTEQEHDKLIVEFWTGLKDKNGTEIFEGDIITLSYGIPAKVDTLVIEYADDETVADISVSGWWMRNTRPNGCSSSLCKTYENDLEVIGNIHQHPDLLKGETP